MPLPKSLTSSVMILPGSVWSDGSDTTVQAGISIQLTAYPSVLPIPASSLPSIFRCLLAFELLDKHFSLQFHPPFLRLPFECNDHHELPPLILFSIFTHPFIPLSLSLPLSLPPSSPFSIPSTPCSHDGPISIKAQNTSITVRELLLFYFPPLHRQTHGNCSLRRDITCN